MKKTKRQYIPYLALAVVSIIAVAGFAYAQGSFDKVFNIQNYYEAQPVSEAQSVSDSFGGEVEVEDKNFLANVNINGTLTAPLTQATKIVALNFLKSTGTASVATPDTQVLVGSVKNDTGSDLLCNYVIADLNATGIYGYELKVGTSTSATSSDAHLIAQTYVTTSTDKILNKTDQEGTETADTWVWDINEYVVATEITAAGNATSAASFTTAGGNTGSGKLLLQCVKR